jgi:hypothetical protein
MKNCLINQPAGLGDILFIQPIVDNFISQGYIVHFPVLPEYLYIKNYIQKKHLIWYDINKDFPMREHYHNSGGLEYKDENNIYVPLEYSDRYIRSNAANIAKYFYTNTPLDDWRKHLNIKRNLEREKILIDTYNLYGEYILINKQFTGRPYEREISIETDVRTVVMDWEKDKKNNFILFDWISALENAKEIHSVGTSLCYLVDKYCDNNKIYIYERRWAGEPRNYHCDHYTVYRNPNWVYMD